MFTCGAILKCRIVHTESSENPRVKYFDDSAAFKHGVYLSKIGHRNIIIAK